MKCARCIKPRHSTRLLKIGEVGDHDQLQCPNCNAKFLFPKDTTAEQQSFNRLLMPSGGKRIVLPDDAFDHYTHEELQLLGALLGIDKK
ncbi:MAG TPA: hypothetical protein VG347_04205 [Verrucomicrobiae bacterium]|nr:hypothetical protein [Verrucomicrobiae bacterium]